VRRPWSIDDPRAAYLTVRSRTEALAAPLGPEDQVVQSMPDASPTKWHRAHTTWFFEEFLLAGSSPGYEPLDPSHRYLFNSYYDAVGDRQPRAARGLITRPTVDEVAAYRAAVDERVGSLLAEGAADTDGVRSILELGLHHEEQHQELLLMDAAHLLAQLPARPAYDPAGPHPEPSPGGGGWLDHDGGTLSIGHDGAGFAYDNESPRHDVLLRPFRLRDRVVTCGEWLEFMDDGGYERADLWLSDGWAVVQRDDWEAPAYWRRLGDVWHVATLAGEQPVRAAEPVVHVSYYEAEAFARWAGARLPTEPEWEAVADHHWSADGGATDPTQFEGAVWQWTTSAYLPYPGFRTAPGAVGEYNGKFMVNQQVLRGSCCATPPGHSRPSYRNFFPAGARWAFSGLRLAADR
jgi:ergothioneine biosynthesis protein EgtB